MTKEQVVERRTELLAELNQAEANYNAITGGVLDCDYWLEVMAAEEEDTNPKPRRRRKSE